ncbi:MAG: ABC transporter ATP-binding protein, partial [Minisyncoccia bacterium]
VRATARERLSAYLTLHSRDYFSNRFAGALANKISHAATGMRDFVQMLLWQFLSMGIAFIASIALISYVHPVLGLLFVSWAVVIVPFNIYRARKRIPLSVATQQNETKLTGMTVDLLTNIGAMQEYTRRSYEMDRLDTAIDLRRTSGIRNWHFGEITLTMNGLIQACFAAAMVFLAIKFTMQGLLSAGDIVLVIALIYRFEDDMLFLGSHINEFTERWGEVQESLEEILEAHEISDAGNAPILKTPNGELYFDNVTFFYGKSEMEVLRDFSLLIAGKEKVGIVGRSGAGKSTLVKLLLRHYDVNEGSISIDDQNISKVSQDSLREAVAVVPQEPMLFHRSLRENIAYGNPRATEKEIHEAARLAQAHDFISALPNGYDTLVGERGVKLSGGERQRVAIARAILKNAPILILDEATAALDSEGEVAIQKALHELMQGKTVIAIAHRLSTLREMDRIIVLERGEIVEDGTHAELLQRRGKYSELWNHQAGGFIQDEA